MREVGGIPVVFLLPVLSSSAVGPGEGEGAVVVIVGFWEGFCVSVGGCCCCCCGVVDADWESAWERFLREKRPRRPRLTWATASGAAGGDVSFAHRCRASSSGLMRRWIQLRARRGEAGGW